MGFPESGVAPLPPFLLLAAAEPSPPRSPGLSVKTAARDQTGARSHSEEEEREEEEEKEEEGWGGGRGGGGGGRLLSTLPRAGFHSHN